MGEDTGQGAPGHSGHSGKKGPSGRQRTAVCVLVEEGHALCPHGGGGLCWELLWPCWGPLCPSDISAGSCTSGWVSVPHGSSWGRGLVEAAQGDSTNRVGKGIPRKGRLCKVSPESGFVKGSG